MKTSTSSIFRDQTGAAMAEALVCFPVFVAVLVSILAAHGMYAAKLEAKSRARRLAWLQADAGGCPSSSCRSEECAIAARQVRDGDLRRALAVSEDRFSVSTLVGEVRSFFLGAVTHGLGFARSRMPSGIATRLGTQSGVTTLPCNTTARQSERGVNVLEHACRAGLATTEYAREVCR